MKRLRVLFAILAMLTLSLMMTGCGSSGGGSGSTDNTVSLTILETSDVHDHAGGFGSAASYTPMVTGNDTVLGGYARLATYISDTKNQKGANNVLLCDDGDFTMGTVYTMTLASSPLSFMFFQIVGYDAITLGNHELDLGANALAGFINLAKANTTYPFTIPIVATNMNNASSTNLNGLTVPYTIIEKAGIKIAILGQLGPNAVSDSPNASPLSFANYNDGGTNTTALQNQVNDLRNNQSVQMVVLLSHEGFTVNSSTGYAEGNDAFIADHVSGIDVILSGHLHLNKTAVTTAANPNTILVEPGAYGAHIARLDLKVDKTTGKITSYTSTNPTIDDTIVGDSWMNYIVGTEVNSALNTALNTPPPSGHSAFYKLFKWADGSGSILDTVAINDAPINDTSITTGYTVGESVLGNLAADSYRNAINGIWAQTYLGYREAGSNVPASLSAADTAMTNATGDSKRVDIAFVPGGVIRDPLAVEAGTISFADLYNVLPLGADSKDTSAFGYPLLTTYVKALDIYKVIAISLSMGMAGNSDYYINFAGIYVKLGAANLGHFGHGFDVYLCPQDTNSSSPNYDPTSYNSKNNGNIPYDAGTLIDLATDTSLYKVSVDLYTLMMMYYAGLGINTYNSSGVLLTPPPSGYGATQNRVWTSGSTTLRAWQAIEAWSWAVGSHAAVDLSTVGYTKDATVFPYRRIQQ